MHTRCPPRWPTVSRIIAAGERKKKKSQALLTQWSLDLGFVVFSTPFPVLSYVSCLEAAKPSGRPVEPSVGAVNLLESTHDFPTVKTPGEVSLTSLSLSTSNPRTISSWRFETECTCSIISCNDTKTFLKKSLQSQQGPGKIMKGMMTGEPQSEGLARLNRSAKRLYHTGAGAQTQIERRPNAGTPLLYSPRRISSLWNKKTWIWMKQPHPKIFTKIQQIIQGVYDLPRMSSTRSCSLLYILQYSNTFVL